MRKCFILLIAVIFAFAQGWASPVNPTMFHSVDMNTANGTGQISLFSGQNDSNNSNKDISFNGFDLDTLLKRLDGSNLYFIEESLRNIPFFAGLTGITFLDGITLFNFLLQITYDNLPVINYEVNRDIFQNVTVGDSVTTTIRLSSRNKNLTFWSEDWPLYPIPKDIPLVLSCEDRSFSIDRTSVSCRELDDHDIYINIKYAPKSDGKHYSTLFVNYNEGSLFGDPDMIFIDGTAIEHSISTSSPSVSFSETPLGRKVTKSFKVTAKNLTGTLNLELRDTTGAFTINPCTIDADKAMNGNGVSVNVSYEPKSVGTHEADIIISGGGAFESQTVHLTGEGIPSVSTSTIDISFPDGTVGYTRTQTFTITGKGLNSLLTVELKGDDKDDFEINRSIIPAAEANSGVIVTVTYKPSTVGTHKAYVSIHGGGATSPNPIGLTGTAVERYFTTSETSLNFGTVAKDGTYTKEFTIEGTNVSDSVKVSTNSTFYTVSPAAFKLGNGGERIVTVTYKPTAVGTHNASLFINGGEAGSKSIPLKGIAVNPVITVSPTSIDFGTMAKGKTVTKQFTVTGTDLLGNLTVSSNSSYYTVSPDTITAAQAASGTTVTVTFKCTVAGTHSGTITISGGDAAKKTVSLLGKCVVPTMAVSSSSLAFGTCVKGNPYTKEFTVTGSDLTGDLTVSASGSYFTVSPTSITPAEAKAGKTVTVTYKPTATGNHSGTVTVSGGDAPSKTVNLSGTCVVASITASPSNLTFTDVLVGTTSSQTFKVTGANLTGPLTLTLTNTSGMYSISPTTISAADAAAGKTVTVTYKPTQATTNGNSHGASVTISGGDAASKTVKMVGTAINPSFTTSVSSMAFGTVIKGDTNSKTFTVSGNLASNLALSTNSSHYTVSPTSITPAQAKAGKTVTVTYKPSAVGTHNATLTIKGGGASSKTVSLSGTCVAPAITISPTNLTFTDVLVGTTTTQTFNVKGSNLKGSVTLTLTNTSGMYSISPTTISAADAAAGKTVTVTYKPTQATTNGNSHGASVTITSNGAESKTVKMLGTAINPSFSTSATSLAFGTVIKGDTNSKTFTVSGNLASNLTLSTNSSYYTVSPTSITPAQAKAGKTVTVTYAPTAAGTHSATLTIKGGGATSKSVSLSGTCVVSAITVNPANLTFSDVLVGTTATKTFKVTGTNLRGSVTLSLTNTSGMYSISPTTITAADATAGKTVTVTYKPTQATTNGNNHGASVTVSSSGAESKTVKMVGTAITPSFTASVSSLSFGTVLKDNSSQKTFTVSGNVASNLTLSTKSSYYTVSPTTITPAQAKAGTTVTVTYKPTAEGTHNATLTISGGGATSKSVSLSGTCVVPTITTSVTSLSFTAAINTQTFKVTGTNLSGSLTLTCDNPNFTVNPTTIGMVEAKSGVLVTVLFNPYGSSSNKTGKITISGGGADAVTVNVSGTPLLMSNQIEQEEELNGSELNTLSNGLGSATNVNEVPVDVKIYAEGGDIVIETPVEQSAVISDIAGRARRVNLQAGRNVIPVNASGVHIVRVGEKTAKLMLK